MASCRPVPTATTPPAGATSTGRLDVEALNVYYGTFRAVRDITLTIKPHAITAIIGPSGCGKSTFLRSLNRMHEVVANARVEGAVRLDGIDVYGPNVDPVQLRRRRRHGLPATQSVPDDVDLRQRRGGPATDRRPEAGRARRGRRAHPAPGRALGRGQGQAQGERDLAVGRPAAAAVHRPGPGGRTRRSS